MKTCGYCGAATEDGAAFCSKCGRPTGVAAETPPSAPPPAGVYYGAPNPPPGGYYGAPPPGGYGYSYPPAAEVDAPNMGFAVLSFFFPLVGLILYLVWGKTLPLKAKSCGKGALIGVIVDVAGAFLYVFVIVAMFSSFWSWAGAVAARLFVFL